MDLVTSIPFDWILGYLLDTDFTQNYNKIFRILKLPKLFVTLKMSEFFSLNSLLKSVRLAERIRYQVKVRHNLLRIVSIVIITYLLLHVFSCLFVIIGKSELFPQNWIDNSKNFV